MFIRNGALAIISKFKSLKKTVSLRLLLFFVLAILGIIPMIVLYQAVLTSIMQNQVDNRMLEIQNQCLILSDQLSGSNYFENINNNLMDAELGYISDIFNSRIIIVDKNFKIVKDTYVIEEGKINISEEVIHCFNGQNSSKYNKNRHYLVFTLPIYDNAIDKQIIGVMAVSTSTEQIIGMMEVFSSKTQLLLLAVSTVVLVFAFVLSQSIVKPFKNLIKVLVNVAEGDLEDDISILAYVETKQISTSINQTLTKLKALDQSRQEFVSNVSHELKTPITSIRVLADSLISMEDAPVELYREFMVDISDEIDRESKIIDDLLSMVKMDKSATELNVASVNINDLLNLILKRLRPIAKKKNIELVLESIRPVSADIDEVKLTLALSNLVENAIKYNIEEGWVKVTLDADHKFFYVKVADSGIGIAQEFQEHVFDRFYRVDKARSRETGGTGLGLAITKSVVLLHHGALKLSSKEGEGTTFTVRVPLTYIA